MSGRHHHYLPQAIQRPFAFRTAGKTSYVHVHYADRSHVSSTKGIGQERDFYGNPEISPADENITRHESELFKIHQSALLGDLPTSEACAELICTLGIRTKSMRDGLRTFAGPALRQATAVAMQPGRLEEAIKEEFTSGRTAVALREHLSSLPPGTLPAPADELVRAALKLFEADIQTLIQLAANETRELSAPYFQNLVQIAPTIADGGFRRVFELDPRVPERAKRFTSFNYSLLHARPGETFILGDCAAVARRNDGIPRLPLADFDAKHPLEIVALPLSPTLCLIGTSGRDKRAPTALEINEISAALSSSFFISQQENHDSLENLRKIIGSADALASSEEIESILNQPN